MPSQSKTVSKKEKVVIKKSVKKVPVTSHKRPAAKKSSGAVKRAEYNLLDASVGKSAVKRMARRAAIARISESAYPEIQKISIRLLKSVLHNSMLYSHNKNRSILNTDAVNFGLDKSGLPLFV